MKRFLTVTLLGVVVSVMTMTMSVWAIPAPTPQIFVHDFAEVLTPYTRDYIVSRGIALSEFSDAQVVVTTVNFTDGMSTEDFATAMYNQWGIGSDRADNGLLLLLVIQQDDYFIARGDGMSASITDGTLDMILFNYLEPHFDTGNFDQGVMAAFTQIMDRVESHYAGQVVTVPVEGTQSIVTTQQTVAYVPQAQTGGGMNDLFVVVILVILVMAVMSSMSVRRRRMGMGGGMMMGRRRRGFFGGGFGTGMMMGSMMGRNRRPNVVNKTVVNKTVINKSTSAPKYKGNSSAFGGGRSSGGGIGRGGSGRSFGGGRSSGGGVGRRR